MFTKCKPKRNGKIPEMSENLYPKRQSTNILAMNKNKKKEKNILEIFQNRIPNVTDEGG